LRRKAPINACILAYEDKGRRREIVLSDMG